MTASLLNYDLLDVSCPSCGNWVELSSADPRRRAEGYGFRFNVDIPREDFTCLACDRLAHDSYYDIVVHHEDGDHELRNVTPAIHAILER